MSARGARQLYLSVFLVAVAACACARGQRAKADSNEVKVEVATIGVDRESGEHFVLLEDQSHRRQLPIMIGDSEAQAIMLALHGLRPPRPLTHDLLRSIIKKTGNHVDRVEIYDLRSEVYYARIYLDGQKYAIDSRPSDAIALAMGTKAPIYVNEKLMSPSGEVGLGPTTHLPKSAAGMGLTVQELTPDLAAAFNLPPGGGLLVAEADAQAVKAGVERGDLVTKIDDKPVTHLADFQNALVRVGKGQAIRLTIMHGGTERSVTLVRDGSEARD